LLSKSKLWAPQKQIKQQPNKSDGMKTQEQLFKEAAELIRELSQKCPDAKEHTFGFMKKDLVDEAIEARMAVDKKDWQELKEELGDVLWSWIDFCFVAEKEGKFTTQEVLEFLQEKIKRRNPHVFGNEKADTIEEARNAKKKAKEQWKAEKNKVSQ